MNDIKKLKFLVIRFSSIGDIVLTTPVVRTIKKSYPNSELHFICKKNFASVVENNPYIDKKWLLDENLTNTIKELKKERFDYIIDLHKNLRSYKIRIALQVPCYSFNKLTFKKWLLSTFKLNYLPKKHLVDRYFDGLKELEIKNDGEGLDFFIDQKEEIIATEKVKKIQNKFISLVIGTAHETKSPTVELLIKIINQQTLPVVLLGGKTEQQKAKKITAACGDKELLDLSGQLSIQGSAAVLKKSSLVITPDTGLMHIAAALNKKIISIWGNTIPELGMYPYYGEKKVLNRIAEVSGLNCRPCSKIGYNSCPKKHFKCMNEQSEEKINGYIQELS